MSKNGKRDFARELNLVVGLFFLAMTVFWLLKPLRKGLIVGHFKENPLELLGQTFGGAQTEQLAKFSLIFIAFVSTFLLTSLSKRIELRRLLGFVIALSIAALVAGYFLVAAPGGAFIWVFYVAGDFANALVLALLWMLLHNSVSVERAKEIYSRIGIGTVAGGCFGAILLYFGIEALGRQSIMILSAIVLVILGYIALFVVFPRERHKSESFGHHANYGPTPIGRYEKKESAVTTNRQYWIALGIFVAAYEITAGIIDFQLSAAIEQLEGAGTLKDLYFGFIGQVQGLFAFVIQVFATGWIIKRLGIGSALAMLPLVALLGSIGFLAVPMLGTAMILAIGHNALNYSVGQSAKETLYVPAPEDEKLFAKSFIDLFVQRAAKAIAVVVNLLFITAVTFESVRWLSIISIVLTLAGIVVAIILGRRFREME